MASQLPPVPYKTPLSDSNGVLTTPWMAWFRQLFLRVGENNAPSNDELSLNPMSAVGDLIYGGTAGAETRLVGNTAATRKFLRQTGTGAASASPVWDTIQASDVPTLNQNTTGTAANVSGTPALPNGTTATTQSSSDNSTKLATTAFVTTAVAGGATVPSGAISMYGGSSAPTGWLLCDGSAVSRTTYAALFTAISTTFGTGDGSTTFNVPDMRGVFPKGAGTTNRTAGKDASGNFYAGTLGTYSTDQVQGHKHTLTGPLAVTAGAVYDNSPRSEGSSSVSFSTDATLTSDGTNGTPRTGHTTEPQSLGVTFIIKT